MPDYDPQFLRHLFDYMIWGDRAMLDAASKLPEAEYYQERGVSFGSIHKLLVHQMAAQRGWLWRWQGNPPDRLEDQTDFPTRQSLRQQWPIVHQELLDFLAQQARASLNTWMHTRRTTGEPLYLPVGGMMFHVVDHASYHRGQLNSMLKQAGGETAYRAYTMYLKETS